MATPWLPIQRPTVTARGHSSPPRSEGPRRGILGGDLCLASVPTEVARTIAGPACETVSRSGNRCSIRSASAFKCAAHELAIDTCVHIRTSFEQSAPTREPVHEETFQRVL